MRVLCLTLFALSATGCATALQGGAEVASVNGALSESASVAAGTGLGDASASLLLTGRLTAGLEPASGKRRAALTFGYEFLHYGGDFESASDGYHVAIHGGPRLEDSKAGTLAVEIGHSWVLSRSRDVGCTITALSIAPMIGVDLYEGSRKSVFTYGLGVAIRSDTFSSWHFHL